LLLDRTATKLTTPEPSILSNKSTVIGKQNNIGIGMQQSIVGGVHRWGVNNMICMQNMQQSTRSSIVEYFNFIADPALL
jgi:hypothetical protein